MKFKRNHVQILQSRLQEPVRFINILVGPRQVGKTTITQQIAEQLTSQSRQIGEKDKFFLQISTEQAVEINTVDSTQTIPRFSKEWLPQIWRQARENALKLEKGQLEQKRSATIADIQEKELKAYVLVIDEIQKIPQWSEQVKALWDEDRAAKIPLHVVLLGSAPLLIHKGLTESLMGRFEVIRVNHWSFEEMQNAFDFDLNQYIYFGAYPGAAQHIQDEIRWREYVQSALIAPSIEHDVMQLHRIEKPALMRRLFDLASLYSGQELSYTKMMGQLQDAGNTTTLAHYLSLLGQAGLVSKLDKYAGEQFRQRASSPKLSVHNTALISATANYSYSQALQDRDFWGRLTESCVGAHLINSLRPTQKLQYWRTSPHEVDFVITQGQQLLAIEVKSGRTRGSVSGLEEFAKSFQNVKTLVIGDATACDISLVEFLTMPAEQWFEA
jgi:uncharacterized protein